MTFKSFQKKSWETAIYPNKYSNLYYPVLGLTGEAGEIANKIKKIMRDDDGEITELRKEEIFNELGNCLWYLAAICSVLEINMDEMAKKNIDKLQSRKKRGKIKGSGDKR